MQPPDGQPPDGQPPDGQPPDSASGRRKRAALAGHLGDEETARRALPDPSAAVRSAALGALARMGRLSAEDLSQALGDESPVVRARSAELAAGLSAAGLPLILSAMGDAEARVVEAACFAAGEASWNDDLAAQAVATLSSVVRSHPDPLCREAAVAALGAIGHPAGLPAVLDATTDKPAIRRRAVLALAPFDGADVDQALQRALEDRDWQVRQAAEDLLD